MSDFSIDSLLIKFLSNYLTKMTLGEAACTQIKIDEQYDELKCLPDVDAAQWELPSWVLVLFFDAGYGDDPLAILRADKLLKRHQLTPELVVLR